MVKNFMMRSAIFIVLELYFSYYSYQFTKKTGQQPFQGSDFKQILRANKVAMINFDIPELRIVIFCWKGRKQRIKSP